jgi:hypothetical protein
MTPFKALLYLWAAPWSLLGCSLGLLGLMTGGRCFVERGVLEFHGGILSRLLRQIPIEGGASAITLGHTVLGRTREELDRCRDHEHVHVHQYERWGPMFVPAYFASSIVAWAKGLDPYLDNAFEREAYDAEDPRMH